MTPAVMLSGCLIWIPVGIWIFSLIGWMIMGEVDFLTGLVGLGMSIGMACMAVNPNTREFAPYLFGATLASVLMYPFVRNGLSKQESKSIDIEALEKAYENLRQRPDNPLSKFTIARRCYLLGMPGHAIRIGEAALQQMPINYFPDEHRTLKSWQGIIRNPSYFEPIACVECQTMNVPGNVHCAACGAPFLLDRARGRVFSRSTGQRLLAVWISLIGMLIGIPVSAKLPAGLQIVAIIGILCLAALMMFLAFRPDPKNA